LLRRESWPGGLSVVDLEGTVMRALIGCYAGYLLGYNLRRGSPVRDLVLVDIEGSVMMSRMGMVLGPAVHGFLSGESQSWDMGFVGTVGTEASSFTVA
jgi:hypothetical protein